MKKEQRKRKLTTEIEEEMKDIANTISETRQKEIYNECNFAKLKLHFYNNGICDYYNGIIDRSEYCNVSSHQNKVRKSDVEIYAFQQLVDIKQVSDELEEVSTKYDKLCDENENLNKEIEDMKSEIAYLRSREEESTADVYKDLHIDDIPIIDELNNRVETLESENEKLKNEVEYRRNFKGTGRHSKLSSKDVENLKEDLKNAKHGEKEAVYQKYGISRQAASKHIRGLVKNNRKE